MRYKAEIEKYIEDHKDEMFADIIKLCEINSEKSEAKEGMPYGVGPYEALVLTDKMSKEYGFKTKNYDNRVLAVDFNDKGTQLDILAHVDVVPAGEGWKETEPFKPVIKDGRIYGRGTSDDKGPVIASLYAMRAIKELGIELSKNVRMIIGSDEECGMSCVKYYYTVEKEAPMTFSPDGAYPVVNIEKGKMDGKFSAKFDADKNLPRIISINAGTKSNVVPPKAVMLVEGLSAEAVKAVAAEVSKATGVDFEVKGSDKLEITALGANAHASTPDNGKNAITALLQLVTKLDFAKSKQIELLHNLYELMPHGDTKGEAIGIAKSDEKSGALTLAFSIFNADEEGFEGVFDLRAPVSAEPKFLLDTCKERFAKAAITFHTDSMIAPHEVPEDSDFVKTLLKCYEEYTGLDGYCIALGGLTYVHDLKNGVAFGAVFPGTDTRMHGADEFAVVDELVASAKIFAQAIVELCS